MELTRAEFIRRIGASVAVGAVACLGMTGAAEPWQRTATGLAGADSPDHIWLTAARFVRLCHIDQAGVRRLLRRMPQLARTACPVSGETPLAGAAHMCRPDIARLLLAAGAPLTPHAAAMLGQLHTVRSMLDREPVLALAPGAHGIPLLYHAALSGKVQLLAAIADCEPRQDYTAALHAAAWRSHLPAARWLLGRGADPQALVLRRERRTLHRLTAAAA
jgi:hypothetical protein